MRPPSRALPTLAVGLLGLDSVLLVYGGLELHRWSLLMGGAVCALGVPVVVLLWRRYRAAIERARREMRAEVQSIRELLHHHHLDR